MDEAIMSILKNAPKEILKEFLDGTISVQPITEQQKVDEYNELSGQLGGADCPICHNKGVIAFVGSSGEFRTKDCECMKARRSARLLDESGLRPLFDVCRFDNFDTDKPWRRDVKDMAIDYLEHGSGWLYIAGSPGTGKTHICTAICAKLLEQNKSVRYMVWRDDSRALKAAVNDSEFYNKRMNELKNTDVLYIDDFLKGSVSEADINLSFELLNSRYMDISKLTLISGERDINEIIDIDEAVGSRIYQRSKGHYYVTPQDNYRLQ